jgi:hypothetical protein
MKGPRAGERRFRGVVAATLLAASTAGAAAASGGHGDEAPEPVPTGAELAERCAEYREELEFTRAQLKARNVLGRWDFVKAEHRRREKFVDAHCDGEAGGDGGPAHAGAHDDARHGR